MQGCTVKSRLVAEIAFWGWSRDSMVRQASFKGLREYKSATKVVEELPLSKKTGAKNGRRKLPRLANRRSPPYLQRRLATLRRDPWQGYEAARASILAKTKKELARMLASLAA